MSRSKTTGDEYCRQTSLHIGAAQIQFVCARSQLGVRRHEHAPFIPAGKQNLSNWHAVAIEDKESPLSAHGDVDVSVHINAGGIRALKPREIVGHRRGCEPGNMVLRIDFEVRWSGRRTA